MGYTHYFRRRELEHDAGRFAAFVEDVKKALANLPKFSLSSGACYAENKLLLAGGDGIGKPEITNEVVCFNGRKAGDMWHESFVIEQKVEFEAGSYGDHQREQFKKEGDVFSFCKTARKPYDLAVQICLILYKKHFGELVAISSDGDEDDWVEAFKFTAEKFGIVGKMGEELELGIAVDEVVI